MAARHWLVNLSIYLLCGQGHLEDTEEADEDEEDEAKEEEEEGADEEASESSEWSLVSSKSLANL